MNHNVLLLICAFLFLSAVIAAVARRLASQSRRNKTGQKSKLPQVARWILLVIAVMNLAGLIHFLVVTVCSFSTFIDAATEGNVSSLYLSLLLWFVAAVLTIGTVIFAVDLAPC